MKRVIEEVIVQRDNALEVKVGLNTMCMAQIMS
jgi:hypothetical protein